MKKFLTVLVIALIAMTSVFAATVEGGNLELSLTVAGDKSFGFTENDISTTEVYELTTIDKRTFENNSVEFWASAISRVKEAFSVQITLPESLTSEASSDTIGLTYTVGGTDKTGTATVQFDAADKTVSRQSVPVVVKYSANDYAKAVAATYTATMTMTISAQ